MAARTGLGRDARHERHNLVRHFAEMVLAMMAGMAVFGVVAQTICAALGHSGFFTDHVGLRAPLMAFNMTLGMAIWMRYRHHGWAPIAEMSLAMFVPLVILIGPFWAGFLSGGALLVVMHVLMFPAMWLVMTRRPDEYVHTHHAAAGRLTHA